jgi:hypothetical protein
VRSIFPGNSTGRLQLGECELLGIGQSAHARELRGQLQRLGDEAVVFALEEETDLPQGLDIAFLRQINNGCGIGSSRAIRGKRKLRERGRR